jgi:His-Xaa-Ser system protein HxsD
LSDAKDRTTDEMAEFKYLLGENKVTFTLDEELYALDCIYGASYLFIDRCYVFLTRPGDKQVTVHLRAKEPADEKKLEALAGEFANELLNQVLRLRVGESTAHIRDYYMARAFQTDSRALSIDALLAELDAEEMKADPLEIQVPWEQPKAKDPLQGPERKDG